MAAQAAGVDHRAAFFSRACVLALASLTAVLAPTARAGLTRSPPHTPPSDRPTDSDADGVSDERERAQASDPELPGLFPGAFPHIPEPLHFDLVRALGARRGEFEFNVLGSAKLSRDFGVHWAPEVEWAFAERHAIEFELPMVDAEVEAFKVAIQGTFDERRPRFIHGWQAIGEGEFAGAGRLTVLYIAGRRLGKRLSVLGMAGLRTSFDASGVRPALLLNPSVFVDVVEWCTLGFENNAMIAGADSSWLGLPQVHFQLARHFRLQLGVGAEYGGGGASPVAALRIVVE